MAAPQFDVGILAEKKIQAEQYAAALGGGAMRDGYIEVARSPLGRAVIIWGWGHVDRLEEPRDEGEEFRDWRSKVWPHINARPRVLPSDDPKCKRQITAAKKLLPQCAMVIGASDPDREGETIWRHFLELTGARPRAVKRMICAESNPGPQRAAFLALKDPDQYYGRFVAGRAPSVIDLWEGTNHTVACSVFLRPGDLGKGYWPMGRVKGAVLGILHRRHVEIRDFREVAYFEILAEVRVRAGTVTLRHAPSAEERLTDRAAALALAEAARGIAEPLVVEQKPVETAPPKLFSKTSFLTRAGALWGWSGDKSAEILQGLYQDKGLITYPRAELTVVASSDVEKVPRIMEHLRGLGEPFRSAIDRLDGRLTVRRSVVNDREVAEASHTAIIPTDVPADGLRLTEDEAKAYRLIAQRYVAAFTPSAQGLRTTVSMVPRSGPCRDRLFRTAGTVETEPGWHVLFGADDGEAEEEGGETDRLAPDCRRDDWTVGGLAVPDRPETGRDAAQAALSAPLRFPITVTIGGRPQELNARIASSDPPPAARLCSPFDELRLERPDGRPFERGTEFRRLSSGIRYHPDPLARLAEVARARAQDVLDERWRRSQRVLKRIDKAAGSRSAFARALSSALGARNRHLAWLRAASALKLELGPGNRRQPVRDSTGRIVELYGLDLSPLVDLHRRMVEVARHQAERGRALRSIVAGIRCRADLARQHEDALVDTEEIGLVVFEPLGGVHGHQPHRRVVAFGLGRPFRPVARGSSAARQCSS